MAGRDLLPALIDLGAVLLLALGIKGLSKVSTARSANGLAALAMGLAVLGLLIQQPLSPQAWLWVAIGTGLGGRRRHESEGRQCRAQQVSFHGFSVCERVKRL